ncbi:hypothetical protein [Clostridium aciditolerans]|uniref:Uncharacterized protein n=1 Tax=Clostridium aciditolerans TaxID=339861 RepID=A0A934I2B3_9CLOT|nr:hypothetical protein [Clostridium aciditolerans]MBI6873731.1 hypothetical protein [Clostridium aciditolerans]
MHGDNRKCSLIIEIGRRIIYDKLNGKVLVDLGEMQGDVLPKEAIGGLDFIDLPYEQDSDKFSRVKKYHIDVNSKQVVFDELYEPVLTPEQRIQNLENQLLLSENKNVEGGIF